MLKMDGIKIKSKQSQGRHMAYGMAWRGADQSLFPCVE
jgi:biotin operon repressor